MTTYRKIHGRSIQAVTTDPSESVAEGQVWYNTSSDTFKSVIGLEAFSSSASMGTGRYAAMWAGEGTQNATLSCSGRTAAPAIVTNTEEYNGSGWAVGGACNNAENSCAGFGTQTAAIKTGGYPGSDPDGLATESESYNGTSWTSGNAISPGRQGHAGAGVSTAGVIFGGNDGTVLNKTEEFNGTNFSNVNNMNTARQNLSGVGIQTAALAAGGGTTPVTTAAEVYDGTNWTTVGSMNTARQGMGSFGTSTSAAVTGGTTGSNSTATETWDGTSWTTSPATLATARAFYGDCGAGSSTAGIVAGGYSTATIGNTEEYNKSANVITAGAWASGGNLNTGRYGLNGFGATQNAAVAFVGRNTPIYNKTEEYNGTSWTEVNNYPTSVNDPGGTGTLTAGLGLGGLYPNDIGTFPTVGPATYEYDGTDWTSGGAYTYNAWATEMAGTQTAAIASGGHNYPMPPGNRNNSAEYNGSSWTAGNNMSQVRAMFAAGGSQTASFACGGRGSPGVEDPVNATEEYDGTNWSTGGNYLTVIKQNTAGGGPQTAAYMAGGTPAPPPDTTVTGTYDGTSWSTAPNLPAAQSQAGSTTNNTGPSNAMTFGGAPGGSTVTYEFNSGTTTLNVKTLTQS